MAKLNSHIILMMLFLMCFSLSGIAQSAAEKQADIAFANFNYSQAAEYYEKALKRDPGNYLIQEKIGDCYRRLNMPTQAIEWYEPLVDMPNASADLFFKYAQAKQQLGEYEAAALYYEKFAKKDPQDDRAELFKDFLPRVTMLGIENPNIEVLALSGLNTDNMEFGPVLLGDNIIFTSNRPVSGPVSRKDLWTDAGFLHLYISYNAGAGEFSEPERLEFEKAEGNLHEGPASATKDGVFMYFTKSPKSSKRGKDGALHLNIFQAKLYESAGKWVDFKSLSINSKDFTSAHPAVSPDGETMFFMSNHEGGYGGADLYVSYRQGSTWGAPQNLGPGVNTAGNEMFPYLSEEGVLYFASDGRVGLGGLDIYSATFNGGLWGNVKNLGAPINSASDDFTYCEESDGKLGYFASNRYGNDDLYKFEVSKTAGRKVDVIVMDREGVNMLSDVQVALKEDGREKYTALSMTDDKGMVRFTVDPSRVYVLEAEKDGFPKTTWKFTPSESQHSQSIIIKMGTKQEGVAPSADYLVEVSVKDRTGQTDIEGATVQVLDLSNGELLEGMTDKRGIIFFPLNPRRDYEITASYEDPETGTGFFSTGELMTTTGKKAPAYIYTHLVMDKLEKDAIIELPGIEYPYDEAIITDSAARVLNQVVAKMKQYPNMVIELRAHTDCTGDEKYNEILSQKRAQAAVDYIVSKGIDASRISAGGYGESLPKVECNPCSSCSEATHQKNRRTEFKVISLK
jgi:outer membrane protein OmpA-like peptidoglycan-associated protein/tetratricopeptide (TPR) repeat protein